MTEMWKLIVFCLSYIIVTSKVEADNTLLEKRELTSYPLAVCNDNTRATYYVQKEHPKVKSDDLKVLIYLEGGGFCVPRVPGFECDIRCIESPHLCTAKTEQYIDTSTEYLSDNIWSRDPDVNPAFHDFFFVFVPYCSSDVHTGNRSSSLLTNDITFHGHHIFTAVMDDLINYFPVLEATQVVLMGGSAGAIGTEANCDRFADRLHEERPDLDIRCVSDSGSLYPYFTHTPFCYPEILEYAAFEIWNSISDETCMEADPSGLSCISSGTAYPYAETPIMLVMSSEDTTIRICYGEDDEFWSAWRSELEDLSRKILSNKPEFGLYIANCPYHVTTNSPATPWADMTVPVLDGDQGQKELGVKYLISNFLKGQHPYQAIDNMEERNPACTFST